MQVASYCLLNSIDYLFSMSKTNEGEIMRLKIEAASTIDPTRLKEIIDILAKYREEGVEVIEYIVKSEPTDEVVMYAHDAIQKIKNNTV